MEHLRNMPKTTQQTMEGVELKTDADCNAEISKLWPVSMIPSTTCVLYSLPGNNFYTCSWWKTFKKWLWLVKIMVSMLITKVALDFSHIHSFIYVVDPCLG